jgi:hypothetical protein
MYDLYVQGGDEGMVTASPSDQDIETVEDEELGLEKHRRHHPIRGASFALNGQMPWPNFGVTAPGSNASHQG